MRAATNGVQRVHTWFRSLLRDRQGATVVEYGMLIGLVSIILIVGFQAFGNALINNWLIVQGYTDNALAKH
jgi:pilus assembly protein Flp/PilA